MRFIIFLFALASIPALASDPEEQRVQSALAKINRVSYLDIAGGQSLLDAKLGLGVDEVSPLPLNADPNLRENFWLSRVWIYLGLVYPFAAAFSLAVPENGVQSQYSGFLQWTAFERLQYPALALRASYNTLRTLDGNDAKTLAFGGATSWGYQIFSLILNAELRQDTLTVVGFEQLNTEQKPFRFVGDVGLHVQVIPAAMTVAIGIKQEGVEQNFTANIQLQI